MSWDWDHRLKSARDHGGNSGEPSHATADHLLGGNCRPAVPEARSVIHFPDNYYSQPKIKNGNRKHQWNSKVESLPDEKR
jgi:hypothetical protein